MKKEKLNETTYRRSLVSKCANDRFYERMTQTSLQYERRPLTRFKIRAMQFIMYCKQKKLAGWK